MELESGVSGVAFAFGVACQLVFNPEITLHSLESIRMLNSTISSQMPSASEEGAMGSGDQLQHEQDFAAALQQNAPAEQVDAQPAAAANEMTSGIVNRLDTISRGLRADAVTRAEEARPNPLAPGDPASVHSPEPPTPASDHKDISKAIDGALDSYRHLVTFSIQAQVTTTSSTTGTKTFNQLMRGS